MNGLVFIHKNKLAKTSNVSQVKTIMNWVKMPKNPYF